MSRKASTAALLLATSVTLPAGAQESLPQNVSERAPAEVLVLGVYHMSNPGRDIFNTQADDVLSARRQTEVAQVIAVLERFRPTKIAVEAAFGDERVAKRYSDYLAGNHELSGDETEQRHLGWLQHAFGSNPRFRLRKLAELAR